MPFPLGMISYLSAMLCETWDLSDIEIEVYSASTDCIPRSSLEKAWSDSFADRAGVISVCGPLTEEELDLIREAWMAAYVGPYPKPLVYPAALNKKLKAVRSVPISK